MQCEYFASQKCGSCAWLDLPYTEQISQKQISTAQLVPAAEWLTPAESSMEKFRNKVKLVVSGSVDAPKLGIIGQDLTNCPLPVEEIRRAIPIIAEFIRLCKMTPYRVETNTGVLKYVIVTASPVGELLIRFVVRRRGVQGIIFKYYDWLQARLPKMKVCSINVQAERKAIIEGAEEILVSDQEELSMPLKIPYLAELFATEELGGASELCGASEEKINNSGKNISPQNSGEKKLTLALQPKSFFQTNTGVAQKLYGRVASWVGQYLLECATQLHECQIASHSDGGNGGFGSGSDGGGFGSGSGGNCGVGAHYGMKPGEIDSLEIKPVKTESVKTEPVEIWDLYCGVGGFALATAKLLKEMHATGRALPEFSIRGVEVSSKAIMAAKSAAKLQDLEAEFIAGDATLWAENSFQAGLRPQVVIVNPPRRGIGAKLAQVLNETQAERIIYSSCNAESLAKDLAQMPSYHVEKAQIFDIFPHTSHVETVALLSHQKLTEYVQIPYEPEDKTAHAFRDATYKEIKDWIKKVFDMKVSSLYIAQIKDECGLEKRQNYNKSKKENAKVPTCPKEKRKAILAALRHFQMIDNE